MSRARNIKPGFFKNEDLAELPFEYRILFQGLWCLADRAGRLEDRPKRIKGETFPYDNVDVEMGLQALASAGFIIRYEVEGRRYIQILAFLKHQNPHAREQVSVIPAHVVAKHNPGSDETQPRQEQAGKCTGSAGLIPDSPSLIPEVPTTSGAETPDPIFGVGLDFLKRKGVSERSARAFLGLLRKEIRDDLTVAALLGEAELQDISEPQAWLTAAAKARKNTPHARGSPTPSKTMQAIQNINRVVANGTANSKLPRLDPPRTGHGPAETALPTPRRTTGG